MGRVITNTGELRHLERSVRPGVLRTADGDRILFAVIVAPDGNIQFRVANNAVREMDTADVTMLVEKMRECLMFYVRPQG